MAGTNYVINPVKATCIRYKGDEKSIQGINDTCYGICAAFSGANNVYMIDPNCAKACKDFVEERKVAIFGVGSCDHQTPYKPVIWNQVPRFVPRLLQKGLRVEEAREQCKKMCSNSSLVAECREYCDIDANAVEVKEEKDPMPTPKPVKKSLKQEEQKNPVLFWVFLVLLILCLLLGSIYIYKKWN